MRTNIDRTIAALLMSLLWTTGSSSAVNTSANDASTYRTALTPPAQGRSKVADILKLLDLNRKSSAVNPQGRENGGRVVLLNSDVPAKKEEEGNAGKAQAAPAANQTKVFAKEELEKLGEKLSSERYKDRKEASETLDKIVADRGIQAVLELEAYLNAKSLPLEARQRVETAIKKYQDQLLDEYNKSYAPLAEQLQDFSAKNMKYWHNLTDGTGKTMESWIKKLEDPSIDPRVLQRAVKSLEVLSKVLSDKKAHAQAIDTMNETARAKHLLEMVQDVRVAYARLLLRGVDGKRKPGDAEKAVELLIEALKRNSKWNPEYWKNGYFEEVYDSAKKVNPKNLEDLNKVFKDIVGDSKGGQPQFDKDAARKSLDGLLDKKYSVREQTINNLVEQGLKYGMPMLEFLTESRNTSKDIGIKYGVNSAIKQLVKRGLQEGKFLPSDLVKHPEEEIRELAHNTLKVIAKDSPELKDLLKRATIAKDWAKLRSAEYLDESLDKKFQELIAKLYKEKLPSQRLSYWRDVILALGWKEGLDVPDKMFYTDSAISLSNWLNMHKDIRLVYADLLLRTRKSADRARAIEQVVAYLAALPKQDKFQPGGRLWELLTRYNLVDSPEVKDALKKAQIDPESLRTLERLSQER